MGAAAPQLRAVTLETLACLGQGHSSCAASTSLFAESRLEFGGSLGTDCFSEMLPLKNGGKTLLRSKSAACNSSRGLRAAGAEMLPRDDPKSLPFPLRITA